MTAAAKRSFDILLVLVALFAGWQALYQVVGDTALTSPAQTIAYVGELLTTKGEVFANHAWETGRAFLLALVLSYAMGLAIGIWFGAHRLSGAVGEPILVALYSLPKVTLYPVMLLVFGLGLSAKVAFGALHGIFPMIIFTMSGIKNVKPVYLKAARALRLSPADSIRTILLPAALPEIFTGFRIGFSLSLLGTLIGELFASDRGLGFMLIRSIEQNDAATILALTLLLFAASALAGWLLLKLDRRLRRHAPA